MFEYSANVIRVIDGDTMILDVDLGFKIHTEIDVRLARINAPDTVGYGVNGISDPSRRYIEEHVPIGSLCVAQISRTEKYGRWLADILYLPGANDRYAILKEPRILNDELLQAGLAKPYSGGRK